MCDEIHKKYISTGYYRPFRDWKLQLDAFVNLKTVIFAGKHTEPTTYPYLFDLIKYLKNRNIKIIINTNGTYQNANYYIKLKELLSENDRAIFTICGNT